MNVPGRFSGQFIVWCDLVVFRRKGRCTRSYNTALWTSPDHSLLWSQFQHLSFHFSNILWMLYVKPVNPCQCSAACLVRCRLRVSICSPLLATFYCFYQVWELRAETTQLILSGQKLDTTHIYNSGNSQALGESDPGVVTRLTDSDTELLKPGGLLRLYWCVCCGVKWAGLWLFYISCPKYRAHSPEFIFSPESARNPKLTKWLCVPGNVK